MKTFLTAGLGALALVLGLMQAALAQDARWVQIEARPTLDQALERVRAYEAELDNVNGFRLPSGWYAIALGPFTPEAATVVRAQLRARLAIPADSFVADGTGFRQQYWPEGAAFGVIQPLAAAPDVTLDPGALSREVASPVAAAAPQGETLAEARAAERTLSRAEREDIQRALQWEGVYAARIDGAFGPGTRRAIEAWQIRNAYPATGVLQTLQRNRLVNEYQEAVATLDLRSVRDDDAGVELVIPAGLVVRDRVEAPFVTYGPRDGSGAKLLLISQSGDATTLAALYEVMQTLEIVPLVGERNLGRRSFTISGENTDIASFTFAELRSDAVKGFTLIWPRGDEKRRNKVISELRASFTPLPGQVLPSETAALDSSTRRDLIAGLQVRQPETTGSGFFVDPTGRVLTSLDGLDQCTRITIGTDAEADLTARQPGLGLALLQPNTPLAPIAIAEFDAGLLRRDSEIAVAGYSFGGALPAPSVTFGTVADLASLDGRTELTRLALAAEDGDTGGPVFDTSGSVLGMLLPRDDAAARQLPANVHYAADADVIAAFLSKNDVSPRASDSAETLDPIGLSGLAADMTVLVQCWN